MKVDQMNNNSIRKKQILANEIHNTLQIMPTFPSKRFLVLIYSEFLSMEPSSVTTQKKKKKKKKKKMLNNGNSKHCLRTEKIVFIKTTCKT